MVNQRGKGIFAYLSRPTLIVFGQDVCANYISTESQIIFSFSDICIECETEFQFFLHIQHEMDSLTELQIESDFQKVVAKI